MTTASFFYEFLGVAIALSAITWTFFQYKFQYWKKKGVPHMEPSIPFGTATQLIKRTDSIGVVMKNIYLNNRKLGRRHVGLYFFASPVYVPLDLDYIKNIMSKDFSHFSDRGVYFNERDEPIGAHLFAVNGEKWRNLRTKLTPTFTSGKMKHMFQTLVDCEQQMHEFTEKLCENGKPFDIKEILGCFTTNIIGSCAFGIDCNTFEEENSPFRIYGKKIFQIEGVMKRIQIPVTNNVPELGRFLRIRQISDDVTEFFTKVVKNTVDYREKNNVTRKDFMQLLIELKNNKIAQEDGYKHDGKSLTIDEIVAQSFIFFFAGFETSSTTMTFVLYELARNADIQEKVREEIKEVLKKHDGKVTYEALQDLKYMQQVIDETLRMYPPLPFITRACVKDYKLPDDDDDVIIDKDTRVTIPIMGIHYDPELYPEPTKFDPERFSEENKRSRHPYAHLPFGEGPRICIGVRFGLMQTKLGLLSLLRSYKFTVNKKTQEPLKMSTRSFILAAEGDIWLDAQKL